MQGWLRRAMPLAAAAATALSACASAQAGQPAAAAASTGTPRPAGRDADVEFMRHMIHHHAQAVLMAGLVPERTSRDELRRLARRIEVSQRDEIALMRRWLAAHGAPTPEDASTMEHAAMPGMTHDVPAGDSAMTAMPGMLSAAELARLRAARGPEFDRLFLQGMIRHHEGAIAMVDALFRTRGAAQDPEIFRFASDVDTDQRAEIARMRQLLDTMRP